MPYAMWYISQLQSDKRNKRGTHKHMQLTTYVTHECVCVVKTEKFKRNNTYEQQQRIQKYI